MDTKMKKNAMNRIGQLAILGLLTAALGFSQTTVTSTTLSAAITATQTTFAVASATGITGPGTNNSTLKYLFVDQEQMQVVSISSTTVTVIRGIAPTRQAAHVSGRRIWVGPPQAFANSDPPRGQCTRSTILYLPIISVATGNTFDCLLTTSSVTVGSIIQTNAPGDPVVGGTVASATTITPTGNFFVVSGTTSVATINVPAGWEGGMCLSIEPSGIFATTTAGNIGLVTSATVVGRMLFMCWDGSKWWPSYVS